MAKNIVLCLDGTGARYRCCVGEPCRRLASVH